MIRQVELIRHGMTEGNRLKRYIGATDEPLCAEGMHALGRRQLCGTDLLVVSPMLRALQSAVLVTGAADEKETQKLTDHQELLGLLRERSGAGRVLCETDFRECDFGLFENRNYLELADFPLYRRWVDSGGTLAFPEGEDPALFRERCVKAFCRLLEENRDFERMIVVAHGGTIMSIMEAFVSDETGRKKPFYEWAAGSGEGYCIRRTPDSGEGYCNRPVPDSGEVLFECVDLDREE